MNIEILDSLFNVNHSYDYDKTESPIERFLLNHIIKFLSKETRIEIQYPISTISGSFRADIALIQKNEVIIIECDGKEFHTQELDDWYDEWRDSLILVQRKAKSIYRVKGQDIYNSIHSVFSIISKYDREFFDEETIDMLPKIDIAENWYRKCSEKLITSDSGNAVRYTIEVKRKNVKEDFDSFWFKYVMYSILFKGKNIHELIEIFRAEHYDTKDLIKMLNHQFPSLEIENPEKMLEYLANKTIIDPKETINKNPLKSGF